MPVYETVLLSISGSGTLLTGIGLIYRWHVRKKLGEKLVEKARPEDVTAVTRAVFGRPDPRDRETVK